MQAVPQHIHVSIQIVDFGMRIVYTNRPPWRGRGDELAHQRLAAAVACADGYPFPVQDRSCIVGVYPFQFAPVGDPRRFSTRGP